jgi:isopenicillin N synthase-like dioxygenase
MTLANSSSTTIDEIPIVDISPFRSGGREGKLLVAEKVRTAAETTGFLYISGHGIDQTIVDGAFAASKSYFARTLGEKLQNEVNAFHRGYLPMNASTYSDKVKPNVNESFVFGPDLGPDDVDVKAQTPMHGPNQWPESLSGFRDAFERYHASLSKLGFEMLDIFAGALELPEDFFHSHFKKPMSFVRALHYPSQEPTRADNEFGIAPHTDYGFLTVLAQDNVGGLQVKRRGGGWIDAPYQRGTFVVNIGDMLMRWTNDKWVSTPHRVINVTGNERYSIPFFFDPSYHTHVECIPTCLPADRNPTYEPITWGDYLKMRFDKTYDYRKQKQG